MKISQYKYPQYVSDYHYVDGVRQKTWYNPTLKKEVPYTEHWVTKDLTKTLYTLKKQLEEKHYKVQVFFGDTLVSSTGAVNGLYAWKRSKKGLLERRITVVTYKTVTTKEQFYIVTSYYKKAPKKVLNEERNYVEFTGEAYMEVEQHKKTEFFNIENFKQVLIDKDKSLLKNGYKRGLNNNKGFELFIKKDKYFAYGLYKKENLIVEMKTYYPKKKNEITPLPGKKKFGQTWYTVRTYTQEDEYTPEYEPSFKKLNKLDKRHSWEQDYYQQSDTYTLE